MAQVFTVCPVLGRAEAERCQATHILPVIRIGMIFSDPGVSTVLRLDTGSATFG